MRIELRQIGVRDESRITGGLGVCGRPYCCHAVSDKLRPVSIRMAKDQSLSLNSMKISGQCGRLLCCLSYEHDWYVEARRNLPPEGIKFFYDGTTFKVSEVNPLTTMVKMVGEDGRFLEMPVSRMRNINGQWKIVE
jgi:cell fate regulator YaaT (PSP1 superfamily)